MLSAVNKPTRNRIQESTGRKVFRVVNVIVLILLALICLLPFVNVIAISFSDSFYVDSNQVYFWPKGWTTSAYTYILTRASFWSSFRTSILRVLLGGSLNLFFIILTAYPLSKSNDKLHFRNVYTWYFFITMLVSGGMIPNYLLIAKLGLRDSIWSLVLPALSGSFGVFLMRQNYLTFAKELHEAAKLDGCSNWRFLATIVIPLARPALGALGAYVFLLQWNQYLWPLLVTNSDRVRTVQIGVSQMYDIDSESIALMMSAVIVVLIPSLSIFVFMQKQLINGLMAGAVKG